MECFWAEISDAVNKLEILYETKSFKYHELAGLVVAKAYYHLGALDEATLFALGAGNLLDLNSKTEFVETVITCSIDKYIQERKRQTKRTASESEMYSRLQKVVEAMFKRCFEDKEYKQAVGIAIEAHRLDIVEESIDKGGREMLRYVLDASIKHVQDIHFRTDLLRLLVSKYVALSEDYYSQSLCLVLLNDAEACANLLNDLLLKGEQHKLVAYQVAFDLEEIAAQDFLKKVSEKVDSDKIKRILDGQVTIRLHLEFLHRNNHSDLMILKQSKQTLESRNSLHHASITFANGLMNAGTTCDQFLRDNLDWLSRASNWSKFSATAALGVIHKGHISKSMQLLQPYLPQNSVARQPYSEGGALYALGLLNANHAQPLDYLRKSLKGTSDFVIQHGACLGIGASGMATEQQDIYLELKDVLYMDNANSSDAAALAMGLVMVGSGNLSIIDEMLRYAHETQHERIIRNLSIGMALVMYGREDNAGCVIDKLLGDKDALIRYGGVYMIALAYCGTGSNKALKQLLHLAVSDVNDDVRRASVTSIGFVFLNNPMLVPRIVQLLSESFNPHVRYGACLALGISCASSNLQDALALLEPLYSDTVDFVRQGAFLSSALIQIQHSNTNQFRQQIAKVIADKHEAQLAKFGAVLAQGILDAGGRNCCISFCSKHGLKNMSSIVGMCLFLQYWSWYPLCHFLSLSLQPTALIGVSRDLKLPKFEFISKSKPSLFAYPPITTLPQTEKVEKMHAVLSTSAKAQQRAKRKTSIKEEKPMEIEKPKEPNNELKPNLTRVLPHQEKFISFCSPFIPIKPMATSGILVFDAEFQEYIDLNLHEDVPDSFEIN